MRTIIYLSILILIVLLWNIRYHRAVAVYSRLQEGQRVSLRARVTSQPYHKDTKQIIRIGTVTVIAPQFPTYVYGDRLEVSGKVIHQLTKFGDVNFILIDPSIRVLTQKQEMVSALQYQVVSMLLQFRSKLMQNIGRLLPEPHASLLSGVLLGQRRSLPETFSTALQQTGTLHVVVASGYNVSVIAGVLSYLFLHFFSRRTSIVFVIFGVILYVILAGADPPVVRAGLMGMYALFGHYYGKQYHGIWVLFVTSLAMALFSPLIVFDIGFQLSVAATLGILVLTPQLVTFLSRFRQHVGGGLIEELSVTLGAQIMVLPLLLYHFERISWISPLVNILIVPLIPLIMGMGGFLILASFVSLPFAQLVALFVWVPLAIFIWIVNFFGSIPFAQLQISGTSWLLIVVYYVIIYLIFRTNIVFQKHSSAR